MYNVKIYFTKGLSRHKNNMVRRRELRKGHISSTEVGSLTKGYAPRCHSVSRQRVLLLRRVTDDQNVVWNPSSRESFGRNEWGKSCLPGCFTSFTLFFTLALCLYLYPLLLPFIFIFYFIHLLFILISD